MSNACLKSTIGGVRRKSMQSAQVKGGVFVSRLRPTTDIKALQDYVLDKTNIRVKCFELKSKHDSYKSFRILVGDGHRSKLLVPSIWPQHVVVRQYFD